MRKALKFLHSLAAIGYIGALGALLVLHASLPDPSELDRFVALRLAMGEVARLVLFPSMALVVVAGLLSMAATPAYTSAGWVWAKLISGILVSEGTLVSVQGPVRRGAARAAEAAAGEVDAALLTEGLGGEWGASCVLLAVGVANVALGVWRPRGSAAKPGEDDSDPV